MGVTPLDEQYMHLALVEAKKAEQIGEVPVGAVLIKNDTVIASGHNRQITNNDSSAHAEIIALRSAGAILRNYRLIDTTLYVTLEPCCMCLSALIHARVKRVVYATSDPKTGSLGGCINLMSAKCFNHHIEATNNILQQESSTLLKNFFKNKRAQQ